MIELDGSLGEGGGQILRTSLALSLITQKPFRLTGVRAGRPKPGLQPHHLAAVRAAAAIGHAAIRGDALNSREVTFEPGPVVPGNYRFAIGTAGSTGMVLHTIYLPLAWRTGQPSEITLQGGTHVQTSPTFDFLDTTWRRYLELVGLRIKLRLVRPGFYPRGGGLVEACIQPVERLSSATILDRGRIQSATGFAAVAGLPDHIARRMTRRVEVRLKERGLATSLTVDEWQGGPAAVLSVTLQGAPVPTTFTALGARGKPAEAVADALLAEAEAWLDADAPVDVHSADQIVLPLALADGASEYRVTAVTRHLTTNVAVIRRFLDRDISIDGAEGATGVVRIAASGL